MKSLEDIFGVPNPNLCFYRDMMDEVLVVACGQHIYSSSNVDQHIHIHTYHIHIIYISYTYHIHIIYISYTYHIHLFQVFLCIPIPWSLNFTAVHLPQARGMLFQKCSLAMRAFDWTPRSELYLEPWPPWSSGT